MPPKKGKEKKVVEEKEVREPHPLDPVVDRLAVSPERLDNERAYCDSSSYIYPDTLDGYPRTPPNSVDSTVKDYIANVPVIEYKLPTWSDFYPGPTYDFDIPDSSKVSMEPTKDLNSDFPTIKKKGRLACYDLLAEFMKCKKYKMSYIEYWFIDVVEECIYYSQNCSEVYAKHMIFIVDFLVNFIYGIQNMNLTLSGMFQHFKIEVLKFTGKFIQPPTPVEPSLYEEEVTIRSNMSFISSSSKTKPASRTSRGSSQINQNISFEEYSFGESEASTMEQFPHDCLHEILFILEYIYKTFANTFIYKILEMAFRQTPEFFEEDLPYRMEFPKGYLPANLAAPPKPPKTPKTAPSKKGKKEKDAPPALTAEELEQKRLQEEKERKDALKGYIMPLTMAVGPEFFIELFKPPPKPEKPDKKGKKK